MDATPSDRGNSGIMTEKLRSDAELQGALNHLFYEIGMLRASSFMLVTGIFGDGAAKNAAVESFAIHARGLLHFLYPANAHSDDVLAEHYFSDPTAWRNSRGNLPIELEVVRSRVGKEIAHLTYTRLSVTEEAKRWQPGVIVGAIDKLLRQFAETADRLGEDSRKQLLG